MNPALQLLGPWSAPLGWLTLEAAVVVLAALAVQPLLRAASARRSLWRAVLVTLGLLLAAEFTGASSQLPAQLRRAWQTAFPKPSPEPELPLPLPELAFTPPPVPAFLPEPEPLPDFVALAPAPLPPAHFPALPPAPLPPPVPLWPAWLWLTGLAALLARSAWTHAGFAWLRLRHFLPAAEALRERVQSLAARLGLRRRVRVLASERLRAPAAFGWLRPGVGVPGDFTARFAPAQQDVMLAHELAHLAARDPLWQLLADLVTAALWWHPLVWVARRQHRLAGELAADDASLALPDGPVVLAECLLALGHEATDCPRAALGMAGFRSLLGRRVERLLALPRRDWHAPSRLRLTLQTAAALLALAVLALLPGCAANRTAGEAPSGIVAKWWQAKARTTERQQLRAKLLRKLAETRLPEVTYDGIPLPEVLKMLENDTKRYDPARQGVQFAVRPASTTSTPTFDPDLDTVLIKLDTVLRDVSVLETLDAIVKTADVHAPDGRSAGLQYTLETNRVVFHSRATPTAFASPTKATLTPRQRALLQRLDTIVIPEVIYDGLPLPEVIKLLAQDAKRHDPEKKGINLLAASTGQAGIATTWPDHETILIRLNSPQKRLTVRQVLEVICQTAQVKRPDGQTAGLRFTVEDYGIVLTPRVLGQPFAPPRLVDRPAGAAVRAKLDQIILPRVSYDEQPLPEVIKQLAAAARQHDPEQRGVNLLATSDYPDVPQCLEPFAGAIVIDPVTGSPLSIPVPRMTIPVPKLDKNGFPIAGVAPTAVGVEIVPAATHTLVDALIQPDLETLLVRVTPPLTNAPLRKVLDAIVKQSAVSGGGGITYRVEDHGVLFTPDYTRKGFQKPPAPTVFTPPHPALPLATPVTSAAPGPAGPVNPAKAREHCDRLEALVKAVRANPATTAQDLANVAGLVELALAEYSAALKPDAPELPRLRKLLEELKPPAPKPGASLSPVAPPAVSTTNALDISVGRQLFVDDFLVASNSLKRTWHQPVLFSATPLLAVHDQSPPLHPFFESVWFDLTNQHFKLGLANGQRWFRDYHSPSGTNWVPMHAESHSGSPMLQPAARVTTDYESLRVSLSRATGADGIQFGFARAGAEPMPQAGRPGIPLPTPSDGSRWIDMHPLRNGFLVVGRNLYCYFGGKVTNYGPRINLPGAHQQQAAVGLATLRRDGFVSLDAGPEGGVLTTKPVSFTGRFMFVNLRTNAPDGELRVEILHPDGRPIEVTKNDTKERSFPFARENCTPLAADQTLMSVSWQNQTNGLAMLVGRPVLFRFHLKNASLYSFWVGPGQLGRSMGRVAGGGPHFTNDVDTIGNRSYSPLPVKLGALVVGDYLKVELSYREDATNKTRQHQGAIASSGYFPLSVPRLNRVPVLAGKTIDEAQELIREMLLAAKLENPVVTVTKTQPPPASPPGTEFFAPKGSYLVRVGDELGVSVFGRDDLRTQVEVQPDGSVKVPLVGALKVEGKSLSEARETIKAAYQPAHLSPAHVTVTVTRYGTPPRMSAILPTMPDLVVLHPPTLEKLARLRLPEVTYDGMALPAVLASLEQIAARQHPPGAGVDFEIQKGLFVGDDPTLSKPGQTFPPRTNANGSVISLTINPDAKVLRSRVRLNFDMDAVSVKFPSILRDVSALDVLDAIVKSANYPIRFTIETNRVVFWQRPTNEPSPTPKLPAPKPAAPRGALPDVEKRRAVVLREIDEVQTMFAIAQRELATAQRNAPPAEVARCAKVVAELDTRYKAATAELARLNTESKYLSVTRKGLKLVRYEPMVNPGDSLRLLVAEDDSYSAIYPVKRDGSITVKGVGRVPVGGRQLSDAQAAVKAVLEATQLRTATVTLEFIGEPGRTNTVASATNDQRVIYLAGEFITPGPLKIPDDVALTLIQAIVRSGGLMPNGDLTRTKLLRIENGKGAVEEVNVAAILSGTRPATNRALLPGDIIMVPAFAPVVKQAGDINQPATALPTLPAPKPTAAIHHQPTVEKLARLRIPEVTYDGLTLPKVLKMLEHDTKRNDPDKQGVSFGMRAVHEVTMLGAIIPGREISVPFRPLDVTQAQSVRHDTAGVNLTASIPLPRSRVRTLALDMDTVLIKVTTVLRDVSVVDALDAIVKTANHAIGYTVEPNRVVIHPRLPGREFVSPRISTNAPGAANPSPQPSPLAPQRAREPEGAAPVAADVRRLTSPQTPDAIPQTPPTSQRLVTSSPTAEEEALRRQERKLVLDKLLGDAGQFLKVKSWTNAVVRYEEAIGHAKVLGGVGAMEKQYRDALAGLTHCRIQLAVGLQEKYEFKAAAAEVDKLLAFDPKSAEAEQFKRFNERVETAHKGRLASPPATGRNAVLIEERSKVMGLVRDGKVYYEAGQYQEARKRLEEAIALDPTNEAAFFYRRLLMESQFELESKTREKTYAERVVAVTQKWNESTRNKTSLPVPNPYFKTNSEAPFLTHSSKGAQRLNRKLAEIVLPEVHFDGIPLAEVVKRLSEDAQKFDPEPDPKKKGLNFLINDVVRPAPLLDASGNPAPVAQPLALSEGLIRVSTPLKNLALRHALDVICKNAEQPTTFSVEEYAIAFIPRGDATFFSRMFRVSPDAFMQGLQGVVANPVLGVNNTGNAQGGQTQGQPAAGATIGPVRATVPATATTTSSSLDINARVRQFFQSAGVTSLNATNPGTQVQFNPQTGLLRVRGTTNDLRLIEQAIQKVQPASGAATNSTPQTIPTNRPPPEPVPAQPAAK